MKICREVGGAEEREIERTERLGKKKIVEA